MNNRRKKGNPQLAFYPIYDRQLNVIAHEPMMTSKDVLHCMSLFSDSERFRGEDYAGMNKFFWETALSKYTGEHPLYFQASLYLIEQFSKSSLFPVDHRVVLSFPIVDFPVEEKVMFDHLSQLSEKGVRFAVDEFGFSRLSLPFLLRVRPQFIRLAKEVVEISTDDSVLHDLAKILQPFRSMGIQVIAPGIESKEIFDRMLLVADAFQGDWLSRSQMYLKICPGD